ncbi:filamentous hemagglutinin N-terminal domain-containing protein [Thiotrichales bacterium HSG1]|nr:filamentous hemagglutinin N-terminal domain-containing protein [Thiotrichales bacterium HSG1]
MKYQTIPLLLTITLSTNAEVITDGTLGQNINLPGPDFQITPDLGQQHGGNLFHSFHDFNLNSSESATFSVPNNVQNILSRVTGGNPSNIDGLIRSTIHNADIYFLNPYGIMFGPNARLDVQGSFHASTADYLRLGENGRFDARYPNDSLLTVAPVEAFGFFSNTPAPITLQDSSLSVWENETLSLIGGDLTMSGELLSISGEVPVFSREFTSQLDAPNGRINLASIASKGEVIPTESGLNINAETGDFIVDRSKLTTSGLGGGDIFIRAKQFELINSDITGDTQAEQPGGMVNIWADNIILNGAENYSYISSSSFGSGHGGAVNLFAKNLNLSNGAVIFTAGVGTGNAGSIYVKASETMFFSGKYMYEIYIPSVFSTATFGIGQGGEVEIEARNLILTDGVQVASGAFGSGKSGNVNVKITDSLTISGKDNLGAMSGLYATTQSNYNAGNTGNAGDIRIEAGKINILDGGQINTSTAGLGNAGVIRISTNELTAVGKNWVDYSEKYRYSGVSSSSLITDEVSGQAGDIIINADIINLIDEGKIATSAANSGGGNIEINNTNYTLLQQGGQITTSVQGGIGDGGNISIEKPTFVVLNQGKIKAQADAGHGGNIRIVTDQFITSPNSLISASSNLGLDGEVQVESLDVDLTGALKTFGINFLNAAAHMKRSCTIEDILNKSTFYVFPVNGSQPFPADFIANELVLIEEEEVNLKTEIKEAKSVNWTGCRPDLTLNKI